MYGELIFMVAIRRVKRYKRRRSGSDNIKYFIMENKFIVIGVAAAVVVVVLLFTTGILNNQGKENVADAVQSVTPAVETAEPSPSATESATASPDASATASPEASATATPEPSASASAAASTRELKYTKPNMQGDDVWALQEKLGLKPDGLYGQSTADAVREFQKKNDLPADGIAGATTLQKLGLQK
jgi:murein L,D-transpeptidase YcbB/YkuD